VPVIGLHFRLALKMGRSVLRPYFFASVYLRQQLPEAPPRLRQLIHSIKFTFLLTISLTYSNFLLLTKAAAYLPPFSFFGRH